MLVFDNLGRMLVLTLKADAQLPFHCIVKQIS